MKAVVVPRSIFLDSKLRKDFDAGVYAPVTYATLYGENLSQTGVSESVAGAIAQSLSFLDDELGRVEGALPFLLGIIEIENFVDFIRLREQERTLTRAAASASAFAAIWSNPEDDVYDEL